MGLVKARPQSVFIAACGVVVIPLVIFSLYRLTTADYTGRPNTAQLEKEFSGVHEVLGGQTYYTRKPTLQEISATLPMRGRNDRWFIARFEEAASANEWKPEKSESVPKKFCKGRLSLTLEFVDDVANPYVDYGITWTTDQSSFLYCKS